jgi:hypothetical protein
LSATLATPWPNLVHALVAFHQILLQMEDDPNIMANGKQRQYLDKWKTTSMIWQIEDDLDILANGRRPES